MKTPCVYIYPDRSYSLNPDTNPYVKDLANAFEANNVIVIHSTTAWLGVLDIFLHLPHIDAIIFNWVEETANRTMGYIQAIALVLLLPILSFLKIKILWTVHNKTSHNSRNRWISDYFRNVLSKLSDVIIRHSKESLVTENISSHVYYPHPFKATLNKPLPDKEFIYDVLIWGTLLPYKGVKEFLMYVHENDHNELRIHIQGKCPNEAYFKELEQLATPSINIINRFTPDDELKALFNQSKVIVFTYNSESVLSSGALIESLSNYKTVIGPEYGNFKDFQQEGLAYTYTDFEDLLSLIYKIKDDSSLHIDPFIINQFIQNHSWDVYARFLKSHFTLLPETQIEEVVH